MRMASRAPLVALLTTLALTGCGGTNQVEVEGSVSYDGQPIKSGAIAFLGEGDGAGPNSGAAIIDGKYHVPANIGPRPGRYRVEIRWAKPTGEKFKSESGEMLDNAKEGLPDKYNNKSTLKADIAAGKNVKDFPLEK